VQAAAAWPGADDGKRVLINYSTGAETYQAEKLEERFLFLNRRHPRERISVREKSNRARGKRAAGGRIIN